jgi:hypothetical protein
LDENGVIKEISPQILAKVKISYYYAGWLEDRALYHKEYEIMQINEHFAHWLFEHKVMNYLPEGCDNEASWTNWLKKTFLSSEADYKLNEWQQLFTGFAKEISTWHANGKLLQNPAYTIYKAWHLLSVEDKMQIEKARLGLDQNITESKESGLQYASYKNYYDYLKNFTSELNLVSDWQQSDGNYLIQDPMELAVQLLEKELGLKDAYAKFALYNTLSFIRLIKDGRGIWHLKQGETAKQVMINFNNDAQAALEALNTDLVQHYQGQLSYMMVNGLAYMNTDLTLQLIGHIELYKKLNETLFNNLLKLDQNNGKQMIRVGRNIDIEVMIDSINITRAVEETFGLKDLTNETRHNIMELANSLELKSKSLITAELANMGVMVFEIELYDLKEPKKHWWKTALVGVLGVLQIVAGIALMGVGGSLFLNMVGMGMAFSGIGDVLSSIQSFASKTPIDLEFYLKAKAMSYAITITLAGIGAAFDGSKVAGLNDWASKVSEALKGGTTRFLLQGFAVQGLMMAVQPLLSKLADRGVEKNRGNLEASAWRRVDGLFNGHSEAFKRIHVAEKVLNSNQYSSSILSETRQIV